MKVNKPPSIQPKFNHLRFFLLVGVLSALYTALRIWSSVTYTSHRNHHNLDSDIVERCQNLNAQAGPPSDFHSRSHSDRFEQGTHPVLIQNAKIWTGNQNGTEVIHGDILLYKGLIKSIGHLRRSQLESYGKNLEVLNVHGAWVTPGIVDVHSHIGGGPAPELSGAIDDNSYNGIVQPWLRIVDALNTHDDSYLLSIAGGVTTSLVLPGSANAIAGQAIVIKLRETKEKSPSSMLLEPPHNINTSFPNPNLPPRWRHAKHACGENPGRVYHGTRMDTMWEFRQAYNKARQIKEKQDKYCSRVLANDWHELGEFPEDLRWEALVDVLRGRVKVNVHCYEAVDLDGLVRLSNEFKFPIAAFHHAHEAYLVPDLIKKAYGKPPALALFASFARYKREAYRASVFAPRILAQHGLTVTMKSDHPWPVNSRFLMFEAQQAFYYGLPENLALASVTSNAADVLGMGHRVGYLRRGYDADLVVWDSHPLALGATPSQVFIDGIAQLQSPHTVPKSEAFQRTPKVPNFDKEAEKAVKHEGLPPLDVSKKKQEVVVFKGVKSVYRTSGGARPRIEEVKVTGRDGSLGTVVTRNGAIVCIESINDSSDCEPTYANQSSNPKPIFVNLEGGSISPGLVSYGSALGLENIVQEISTNDGFVFDPLEAKVPGILGGKTAIVRAKYGLLFGTRDALLGYRSGVTTGISAPSHEGFYGGLSVAFSLGAANKLEKGATVQDVAAVHVSVGYGRQSSVSTQIAALRRLLLGPYEGDAGGWFEKAALGEIPLVVDAHSADVIATLLVLKREVEKKIGGSVRLTIAGAKEAHLLAKELGEADVGVILLPSRATPDYWEQRRILPGPPITNRSSLLELVENGVLVGIGSPLVWEVKDLPFDIAWAAIESGGRLSKSEALAIGSLNIQRLLGLDVDNKAMDLVATRGGDVLEGFESKVVAVLSARQEATFLFDEV